MHATWLGYGFVRSWSSAAKASAARQWEDPPRSVHVSDSVRGLLCHVPSELLG